MTSFLMYNSHLFRPSKYFFSKSQKTWRNWKSKQNELFTCKTILSVYTGTGIGTGIRTYILFTVRNPHFPWDHEIFLFRLRISNIRFVLEPWVPRQTVGLGSSVSYRKYSNLVRTGIYSIQLEIKMMHYFKSDTYLRLQNTSGNFYGTRKLRNDLCDSNIYGISPSITQVFLPFFFLLFVETLYLCVYHYFRGRSTAVLLYCLI